MASPPSPTTSGDDHARRTFKRDREADTSAQQPTTPSEALPTKKNRLELAGAPAEGDGGLVSFSPEKPSHTASQGVRHISQKVKELSWEERQKLAGSKSPALNGADVADEKRTSFEEGTKAAGDDAAANRKDGPAATDEVGTGTSAQSQGGQTSVSATEQSESLRTDGDESLATASSASGVRTAKSTQLSFSAFSSRSNPFTSGRTASSTSSAFGGLSSQGEPSSSQQSFAFGSSAGPGSWLNSSQSQGSSQAPSALGGAPSSGLAPAAPAYSMRTANAFLPFSSSSQQSTSSQSQSQSQWTGAMSPAAASSGLSAAASSQEGSASAFSSQQSSTVGDKTPTGPPPDASAGAGPSSGVADGGKEGEKADGISAPTSTPARKQAFGFGAFAKGSAFAKVAAAATSSPLAGTSSLSGSKSAFDAGDGEASTSALAEDGGVKAKERSSSSTSSSTDDDEPTPPTAAQEKAATAEDGHADSVQAFQRRANETSTLSEATDRTTGEESERTVFSARARLFEMDTSTQNWKERGTGTIKCNVPNEAVGGLFGAGRAASGPGTGKRRSAARLVMRTEGVLRLILNVVLFPGMSVELAQEKFVRFVAIEDGKLVHLAVRIPQPKIAEELYETIQSRIPPPPPGAAVLRSAKNDGESPASRGDGKADGQSKDSNASAAEAA